MGLLADDVAHTDWSALHLWLNCQTAFVRSNGRWGFSLHFDIWYTGWVFYAKNCIYCNHNTHKYFSVKLSEIMSKPSQVEKKSMSRYFLQLNPSELLLSNILWYILGICFLSTHQSYATNCVSGRHLGLEELGKNKNSEELSDSYCSCSKQNWQSDFTVLKLGSPHFSI